MGSIIRKKKGGKDLGWYIRWIEHGKRRERASHQPSYALARRLLVEVEARVARGRAGLVELDPRPRLTVAELCDKFLAQGASSEVKDLGKWRVRNLLSLRRLLPHLGHIAAVELDAARVARARDALAKQYGPGTVRNSIVALSTACAWAVKAGFLEKNHVAEVRRPKAPEPRLDYLSAQEVTALLAAAESRARTELHAAGLAWRSKWIAISLAVRLGLRKGELFGLRWRDVDLAQRRLTVARSYATTPKSGKARHLRLPAALVPLLDEWREHCPATAQGLLCPIRTRGRWTMANHTGSDHGLPQLLRAAGCRVFSRPWHMLRHSFASHFVQSGGSLLALAQILGHSDVRLTMIYAHLSSDYLAEQLDKVKF